MSSISLVVPVYKVEPYLDRCVQSILNQTFADFELILVDDGSPDRCGELCDSYAQKDNRIQVIHQENGGLSAARNTGIEWALENSDSEWIGFIDSDDWVHPRYLEKLYQAVQDTGVGISICGFCRTEKETPFSLYTENVVEIYLPEDFWVEDRVNATVAWGKLYQKQCFSHLRYPVGKLHEDEYTTYKTLFAEKKIAVIKEPLYYYFQNENGIMNSTWTPRHIDETRAIQEQVEFFSQGYYERAFKVTAAYHLSSIVYMLIQLKHSAPKDGNKKWLEKELRRRLRHYPNFSEFSKEDYVRMRKMAHPCRTAVVSFVRKKKKHCMAFIQEKVFWGGWRKK